MSENLANNAATTLAASIGYSDTTLSVASSSGFPSPNFRIVVDAEIMLVTAVSGTTWTISRGEEGTTAAGHTIAASVANVLTVAGLTAAINEDAGISLPIALPSSSPVFHVDTYGDITAVSASIGGLNILNSNGLQVAGGRTYLDGEAIQTDGSGNLFCASLNATFNSDNTIGSESTTTLQGNTLSIGGGAFTSDSNGNLLAYSDVTSYGTFYGDGSGLTGVSGGVVTEIQYASGAAATFMNADATVFIYVAGSSDGSATVTLPTPSAATVATLYFQGGADYSNIPLDGVITNNSGYFYVVFNQTQVPLVFDGTNWWMPGTANSGSLVVNNGLYVQASATSLDGGAITTDGSGDLTVGASLTVNGFQNADTYNVGIVSEYGLYVSGYGNFSLLDGGGISTTGTGGLYISDYLQVPYGYVQAETGNFGSVDVSYASSFDNGDITTNGSGALTAVSFTGSGANLTNLPTQLPIVVGTPVALTNQHAPISATTAYAVPSGGAGLYRLTYVATVTTVGGTSNLGGATGFQFTYTDADDSNVKTTPNYYATAITDTNTVGTTISGCVLVNAKASTNIQYLCGYTTSGASMYYNYHLVVEKM